MIKKQSGSTAFSSKILSNAKNPQTVGLSIIGPKTV